MFQKSLERAKMTFLLDTVLKSTVAKSKETFCNIIFLIINASGPYYPNMARWELEVILSLVYKMILLILALELANMTK